MIASIANEEPREGRSEYCRPVGDQLKQVFGDLTREPMPDRLRQLAEALDDAFRRGELGAKRPRTS